MCDLSCSELMAMDDVEIDRLIQNKDVMKRIGQSELHVQVILCHMLRRNTFAIEEFNKSSARTSKRLNIFTCVLVILTAIIAIKEVPALFTILKQVFMS